jgi:hypothetical protein
MKLLGAYEVPRLLRHRIGQQKASRQIEQLRSYCVDVSEVDDSEREILGVEKLEAAVVEQEENRFTAAGERPYQIAVVFRVPRLPLG